MAGIWLCNIARAQVSYKNFTTEHGLPSSQVYDILQDSKGYIWFGTDRGLCRYDGYEFVTLTTQDGLQDNVVFRIIEDRKSRLWFTSLNGGLCCYDNGKISEHPANKEIKKVVTGNYINCLYIGENDTLWFILAGGNNKIYKIGPDNKLRQEAILKDSPQKHNFFVRPIGVDGFIYGSIFYPGLKSAKPSFRMEGKTMYFHVGIPSNYPKNECVKLNDGAYLVSFDQYLVKITDTVMVNSLEGVYRGIADIFVDADQNVWLGTTDGLTEYKKGDLNNTPRYYFSGKTVTKTYQDREGGYWVATLEDGVYYVPSFEIANINKENGLADEKVEAITNGGDEIWMGTFPGNLYTISFDGKWRRIPYPNQRYFSDILCLKDGRVLLTNSTQIKDGRFSIFEHNSENLKLMLQSDSNEVLFGGNGVSVYRRDRWILNTRDYGLRKQITAIYKGRDGSMWMGTHTGLYRFRDHKISFLGEENELYKNRISDIKEGQNGQLYISTIGAGILVQKEKRLVQIAMKDGLSSDLVEELLVDNKGNLWAATFKGLNRLTFNDNNPTKPVKIENFTTADGLPSNEIVKLCLADSMIWIGSNKGVTYFNPGTIQKNHVPPPIYITSVKINNHDTSLRDAYSLSYGQRNLRIYFIGVSFKSQGKVLYRYRLQGSGDSVWKYTYDRSVQYTNLAAGNYTFLISARNESGIWSAQPAELFIQVDPHFTETWWFSMLLLIGIIFIGTSGVYIYIRGQRKRHDFEMEIARSEQKALLAQMNPHFLFNALNSILHFIIENEKRTAISYLTKFSSLIRRILEGSNKNLVSLEEELSAIRLYLELEKLRFGDRFDYTITIEEAINPSQVKIPSMLIQPFIENALWHGLMPKTENGQLELRFTLTPDNVVICTIEDNGIGRKKSMQINSQRTQHRSTGLQNIHERISLLNQLYKHAIRVEILDLTDNDNNAAGTRVTLMLPQ